MSARPGDCPVCGVGLPQHDPRCTAYLLDERDWLAARIEEWPNHTVTDRGVEMIHPVAELVYEDALSGRRWEVRLRRIE